MDRPHATERSIQQFDLTQFPGSFHPLVVVVGDRREARPQTIGDVFVYSVSTIDLMFLLQLGLPPDTLIVSDKIFRLIDDDKSLAERFREYNILTIGSPAVNLFSRMINDWSLFRLDIGLEAREEMAKQERIVDRYKNDRIALDCYLAIADRKIRSFDEFVKAGRFGGFAEAQRSKFNEILSEVQRSGLDSYKALLRAFTGNGIWDPIRPDGQLNWDKPRRQGFDAKRDIDFGLVSLAAHPYADDKCVVYAAGKHGPATAYALRLLATPRELVDRPYGGVFELLIPQHISFAYRLDHAIHQWQTVSYSVSEFDLASLRKSKSSAETLRVFISMPMARGTEQPLLALKKFDGTKEIRRPISWNDPFSLPVGTWDFAKGIQAHFPSVDFIVHDVTGLSAGVLFEVGCSKALNKRTVFLWDSSRAEFDLLALPPSLRQLQVDTVNFTQTTELVQAVLSRIASQMEYVSDASAAAKRSDGFSQGNEVLVLASPTCAETLRPYLVSQLSARNLSSVHWSLEGSLDELCQHIGKCGLMIVGSDPSYADGNLALGIGQMLDKNVLELHERGSQPCVMFKGRRQSWDRATLATDLEDALNKIVPRARAAMSR